MIQGYYVFVFCFTGCLAMLFRVKKEAYSYYVLASIENVFITKYGYPYRDMRLYVQSIQNLGQ